MKLLHAYIAHHDVLLWGLAVYAVAVTLVLFVAKFPAPWVRLPRVRRRPARRDPDGRALRRHFETLPPGAAGPGREHPDQPEDTRPAPAPHARTCGGGRHG